MTAVSEAGGARREDAGRLDLSQGPPLGQVVRIDLHRVEVELAGAGASARVTVSDLVAFPTGTDDLIGLLESVEQPAEGGGPSPTRLRIMPIGTLRSGDGSAAPTFTRGFSAYPGLGSSCHLIDGERLRRFISILPEEVEASGGVALGRYLADHAIPAVADGNRLFQRHLALVGSTGAGKSWAVALMLERASRLNNANLIVFDLHGEYGPLTEPRDGKPPLARGLRVAGPADAGRQSDGLVYLPHWLLERDELMALVSNPDDPHRSDQLFRLTEHLQTLKHISLVEAERPDAVATFTVDSPIPYRLEHLVSLLRRDDTERIPQHPSNRIEPGPYFGRLTGFISRLEARAEDPRYGFMFDPPEFTESYDWLAETAATLLQAGPGETGIKVIDLSEVPSGIVPLVTGVLARLVYGVQFWIAPSRRTPICLVCDEAHLYIPADEKLGAVYRASLNAFEAIAKEGRKYGVGLLVVSQRPSDVSSIVLSQCNNFVVMRLTNDYDRAMVERLMPETLAGIVGTLPSLEPGEAVVVGDALLLPTRIKFDPPSVEPASATQPYWSLWAEQPSSRDAILDAVEALRNQLHAR